MKKLMIVGAMLAMLLIVAIPAIAQVSFGVGQGASDTGNIATNLSVSSTGDNGSQCVAPLQFGNSGNVQNAQGFLQYASTSDDIEFEGSSMTFSPTLTDTCSQTVQQAAAAGG